MKKVNLGKKTVWEGKVELTGIAELDENGEVERRLRVSDEEFDVDKLGEILRQMKDKGMARAILKSIVGTLEAIKLDLLLLEFDEVKE